MVSDVSINADSAMLLNRVNLFIVVGFYVDILRFVSSLIQKLRLSPAPIIPTSGK
jgi:hypothetical protein